MGRVSHLQTQLHRFGLLSTQSHPAHRGLQLGQRDARLVHLAEVLRLEVQSEHVFLYHVDYKTAERQQGAETFPRYRININVQNTMFLFSNQSLL